MELKKEWITFKQAREILHMSRNTLTKFVLKYNIRVSKPLGGVYYNLPEILAVLDKEAIKMGI
jgi:hypothetical protein